jgi:hypothetical protein
MLWWVRLSCSTCCPRMGVMQTQNDFACMLCLRAERAHCLRVVEWCGKEAWHALAGTVVCMLCVMLQWRVFAGPRPQGYRQTVICFGLNLWLSNIPSARLGLRLLKRVEYVWHGVVVCTRWHLSGVLSAFCVVLVCCCAVVQCFSGC